MAAIQPAHFMGGAGNFLAVNDRLWLEAMQWDSQGVVNGLASSNGGGLSVDVSLGAAFIRGTESSVQGMYHVVNDATVNVVLTTAHASLDRIDLICAIVEDADISGGVSAWKIDKITGTASGSPVVPTIPSDQSTLVLSQISVLANATTPSSITDKRILYGPAVYIGKKVDDEVSVADDTFVKVDFNTTEVDTKLGINTAKDRYTFADSGRYHVSAHPWWQSAATGFTVDTAIYKNGTILHTSRAISPGGSIQFSAAELNSHFNFVAGDYIEVFVKQRSSVAKLFGINNATADLDPRWSIVQVGPKGL